MAGKFVTVLMLLCINQLAFGDDLAKEKEESLKKIHSLENAVRKAYKDTSKMFNSRPVYLHQINEKKLELGLSLRELNIYEVNKTAEGAQQKGQLLETEQKVFDCIKTKKEKALSKMETEYTENFRKPIAELLRKARDNFQRLTQEWTDEYHRSTEAVFVQSDRAIEEIKRTNSKAYLRTVLAHLEKAANEAIKQTLSLVDLFKNNEIQFDRTLEKGPLKAYRATTRGIVDEYRKAVENCFF